MVLLLVIPRAGPGLAPVGFNERELSDARSDGYCAAGDMIYSIFV